MKEDGQLARVLARIEEVGYVDNFWAIDNYILRLGAIVYNIRHGVHGAPQIELFGEWGEDVTSNPSKKKNYYYFTADAHGYPIKE